MNWTLTFYLYAVGGSLSSVVMAAALVHGDKTGKVPSEIDASGFSRFGVCLLAGLFWPFMLAGCLRFRWARVRKAWRQAMAEIPPRYEGKHRR